MIKPIIGIGADVQHTEGKADRAIGFLSYIDTLRRAGAVPVLIPPQPENAAALAEALDGILLAGGADCDPQVYGEERHETVEPMDPRRQSGDHALAAIARERDLPMLGICLGLQMMNVAAGGSLIQDIPSQVETGIQHASEPGSRVRHDVVVYPGTRLAGIIPAGEMNVNSSHHQAVARVGEGLRVTAKAADEIVEGLEDPTHPFYIGVQWHPEDMDGEESATALFNAFVEAARAHARSRHQRDSSPAIAGDVAVTTE